MYALIQSALNQIGKSYAANEESLRMEIFKANLERAAAHQALDGAASYGVTRFMDLSPEEFAAIHLNYEPSGPREHVVVEERGCMEKASTADSFDWRSKGAVTEVRDQGLKCGSCWAFSAVEELESMHFLAGNPLTFLSTQQVVSCDKVDGGCRGGDTIPAYAYMIENGIASEVDYPYISGPTGIDGKCYFNSSTPVTATMRNYTYATKPCFDSCPKQDENTLQSNLEKVGPVSICVAADTWQFYQSGILSGSCAHSYPSLNHCVQLTGYGTEGTTKYWNVRNQWGTSWGEKGYMRIKFGANLCGLADEATFVVV
jgi:cathepsin F